MSGAVKSVELGGIFLVRLLSYSSRRPSSNALLLRAFFQT